MPDWPSWICPTHRLALANRGTALVCPDGCDFAVRNGIPRFVDSASYAGAFGAQWLAHKRTQLDSFSGQPISFERARRCLGPAWEHLDSALVLEAGCGAGRFTEILLSQGARVVSVDLSNAVDANAELCPPSKRHLLAQADLNSLPVEPGHFDIVFCLGVIQHTPSPEQTIRDLHDQVRPGGWLVIDHYIRTWRRYTRTSALIRPIMKRLPPSRSLRAAATIVRILEPMHLSSRRWRLAEVALTRLSPATIYDDRYAALPPDLLHEWSVLDTHDSLTDWYKHARSTAEIEHALKDLGMVDIAVAEGGNGVEARARRAR